MFTGIVVEKGKVMEKRGKEAGLPAQAGVVFVVDAGRLGKKVKLGSSVCISGVCLTVTRKKGKKLFFDVMPETLKKTTLGEKEAGAELNLELTLRAGDEIGGHFVYGHVDGVGEVVRVEPQGDNRLVTIKPAAGLMRFIVPQGSVAVDGVSLTVASFAADTFTVSLIPYTLEQTTLGDLKVGDRVNVENDMMLKALLSKTEELKN